MKMEGNKKAKYCMVPMCKNNSRNAPDKVFFHVSRDANVRKKWCKAVGKSEISPTSGAIHCCEDHFNIEEDTENYIKYKIMANKGQKTTLRLKKGIIPRILKCKNINEMLSPEREDDTRKRQELIEEALSEYACSSGKQCVTAQKIGEPFQSQYCKERPSTSAASTYTYIEDQIEGNKKAKYCMVPMCKNNSRNAPDKVFFHVPRDPNVRKKWWKAVQKSGIFPTSGAIHCCEDHFNIEEDTENYIKYKIMANEGQKTTLRLKKDIIPHILKCKNINEMLSPERGDDTRKKQELIEEALSEYACSSGKQCVTAQKIGEPFQSQYCKERPSTSAASTYTYIEDQIDCETGPSTTSSFMNIDTEHQIDPKVDPSISNVLSKHILQVDKAIQVKRNAKYRSKRVSVNFTAMKKSIALSPFRIPSENKSTSPIKSIQNSSAKRSLFAVNPVDILSITSKSSLLSTDYEPGDGSSESSWVIEDYSDNEKQFKNLMRTGMLTAIEREPKMLIGLPKRAFYLIKLLSETIPLPTIDILITLKKIKLNESFSILALHFGYTQSTISRIFSKSIVIIAEKLKELIIWPTPSEIFKNLPISFRARYKNVVSIIDCLEIEIEKPTNAVHQSLTWSQYKKCNTLKYLISCTPDGLVNFISDGYGGRATDVTIVEDCGFIEHLPPNKAVMADRGFKDLSCLLQNKNCTLVRPPSVSKSMPSTKEEVKLSKRIAALRIHIERVINRLREFHMLLPHACIDHNLIPIIDEVIVVACGLINMQDVLIKK